MENESLEDMAARLESEADETEGTLEAGAIDEPVGPTTAEILAPVLGGLFGILTPAWNVTPGECNELAGAYALVIDKYFPDTVLGCEITAIICTVAVIGPRIGTPRKIESPGTNEEKGAESAARATKNNSNSQFPPEGVIHE